MINKPGLSFLLAALLFLFSNNVDAQQFSKLIQTESAKASIAQSMLLRSSLENHSDPDYFVLMIADHGDCDDEDVVPEANFYEDLGYDYLDFIELLQDVWMYYEVNITEEEAETILTVQDLEDAIFAHWGISHK